MKRGVLIVAVLLSVAMLTSVSAAPFTFQGRLNNASGAASGLHDFKFRLYSAQTGGTQIGSEQTKTGVAVDGGLFSTSLDFGNAAFDGGARWLEIDVQVGGFGSYTTLAPRQEITAAPYAMHSAVASDLAGTAHVLVQTTASATENAANLLAAYAKAKTLTPNGQALSATNRAVVLVPPGNYDLGIGNLLMDAEYVDVVGLSSNRDSQYIFGAANGLLTGVLRQIANDVRIANLKVYCSSMVNGQNSQRPSAYYPDSDKPNTEIRNCTFVGTYPGSGSPGSLAMKASIIYSGKYTDCEAAGWHAFGGMGGTASGTFINCTGGDSAFGGTDGFASGTFTNCVGGSYAFGGSAMGMGTGAALGKFYYCRAGTNSFLGATTKYYCVP